MRKEEHEAEAMQQRTPGARFITHADVPRVWKREKIIKPRNTALQSKEISKTNSAKSGEC